LAKVFRLRQNGVGWALVPQAQRSPSTVLREHIAVPEAHMGGGAVGQDLDWVKAFTPLMLERGHKQHRATVERFAFATTALRALADVYPQTTCVSALVLGESRLVFCQTWNDG
jgi:hypothetical protein